MLQVLTTQKTTLKHPDASYKLYNPKIVFSASPNKLNLCLWIVGN
jgi:hypothetical protein